MVIVCRICGVMIGSVGSNSISIVSYGISCEVIM